MSQVPMQNGPFLAQQMLQHDRFWVPEMVQIPRKMMQRGALLSRPFPLSLCIYVVWILVNFKLKSHFHCVPFLITTRGGSVTNST